MLKILTLVVAVAVASACAPRVNTISIRNPDLFEKESDRLSGVSRGGAPQAAPEMYVKRRQPMIRDADRPNETGSLFNPDDERNYLFAPSGPTNVGRFLTINVIPNRQGSAAPSGAEASPAEATPAGEPSEEELLKALPQLAPKTSGDPSLLKSFKMQVIHRYANGDVLARLNRRSQNEDQAADITAEARIPYDRLAAGDKLTTDDLLDVNYVESGAEDLIERSSSGWEDEYSLRLSGFSEAKSKAAADLADQRKQMEEVKEKLETRIKTFADERKQVAMQRDDMTKKTVEAAEKVKTMQGQIADQQETIEEQKKQIDELAPEQKQGDDKEGGG